MSISTSTASNKPSKLLGLYLWVKSTNPHLTFVLAYILKQLKRAVIAAEKDKLGNNFYERFIKQEEEYDLIIDDLKRKEMEELEKKAKEKEKHDNNFLIMIHRFERACIEKSIVFNPDLMNENLNAKDLKSSLGLDLAPDKVEDYFLAAQRQFFDKNVDKMPEFKQIEHFILTAEQQWRDKMKSVIDQLKENAEKIIVSAFLKHQEPTVGSVSINKNPLKDIPNTLQYLEAEYKKRQVAEANTGVKSPANKLGNMLEGQYTKGKIKEFEQKLGAEKKIFAEAPIEAQPTAKRAMVVVKTIEDKMDVNTNKKSWVPKPKPRNF